MMKKRSRERPKEQSETRDNRSQAVRRKKCFSFRRKKLAASNSEKQSETRKNHPQAVRSRSREERIFYPFGKLRIRVRSLSAERVPDKLISRGIRVFSAAKPQKNEIALTVRAKDREKVFAILQGSCYNIIETRPRGVAAIWKRCSDGVGLLIGAAVFCLLVTAAQSRVLRIEVVGSGAYYEREVLQVLAEEGVRLLSKPPERTSLISSRLLALPQVSFCSIRSKGGVLTVELGVSEEDAVKSFEPLLSPAAGKIVLLSVVRGRAVAAVGDEVKKGQTLVEPDGESIVIAHAVISYEVREEFPGSEETALLSAYLKYGEIQNLHIEKTDGGCIVSGTAFAVGAINLG